MQNFLEFNIIQQVTPFIKKNPHLSLKSSMYPLPPPPNDPLTPILSQQIVDYLNMQFFSFFSLSLSLSSSPKKIILKFFFTFIDHFCCVFFSFLFFYFILTNIIIIFSFLAYLFLSTVFQIPNFKYIQSLLLLSSQFQFFKFHYY